jgi:hypothetical protein
MVATCSVREAAEQVNDKSNTSNSVNILIAFPLAFFVSYQATVAAAPN